MAANNLMNYLALGDSYTIGECVSAEQSFPQQLVNGLNMDKPLFNNPDIIAVTGWTTGELINAIKTSGNNNKYNLVTLLIGVNNQYRGYSKDDYRTEFIALLNTAIAYASGNKQHVFVLSIPDWGITPFAKANNRDAIQTGIEIDEFNAINKQETENAGITYLDITPSSREAVNDPELIAEDGLHPSGKMYTQWVELLLPVVKKLVPFH